MAQGVKDPTLLLPCLWLQLWCGLDPGLGNSTCHRDGQKKKHKKTEQTSKNEVVPFAMLVEDTSKCLAGKTSDQTVNLLHILPSVLLVGMGS